jgi:pimeloyl-ACP methyl ester carboxylesterase
MPLITTRDGNRLHYNDWGCGSPIVLVHGWPLDADMWEYQSVFLAEHGFRVITYDRRGFGRSSQPWGGYEYDTLADDLAAVIDALELRDITLVGFSMGGGEVVRYAALHGADRVARIALVSAVTPYLLKTPENPEGVEGQVFRQMVAGLRADRPGFISSFGKTFFGAGMLNFSVSSEILEWALMMAMRASPKATLDCVTAFSSTDFRHDLRTLRMPTLLVHGDADQTVPLAASAARVAALVPHAELAVYGGAPHALMYTERDRLNDDLVRFAGAR